MTEELLKNKLDEIRQEHEIITNNSGDLNYINLCTHQYNAMRNVLEELLKEIQNTDDKYKKLVKELKNQPTNYITKYLDKFGFVEEKTLNKLIEELETKYGIGVE